MDLSHGEIKVLEFLKRSGTAPIKETDIRVEGMSVREISSSISWLEAKGYARTTKNVSFLWKLGPEGVKYLESGLPEYRALKLLLQRGDLPIKDLVAKLGPDEMKIALAQLAKFGIKPSGGTLTAPLNGNATLELVEQRQSMLVGLSKGTTDPSVVTEFRGRENL
ncbi:phenylalanyl-tRNA synthetase subunit alpha, partial [mine drainage metagenome]